MGGLEQEDIAVWFATTNGKATFTADSLFFEFQILSIGFSDMDGDWGIEISGSGDSEDIWAALRPAKNISLTVGRNVTGIPHTKEMDELVKACAAR